MATTPEEMAEEMDRNPELKKLMYAALEVEKTNPEVITQVLDFMEDTKDLPKRFYTVPEAAEVLHVCPKTIYNMAHRREIEYYKPGAQIRIPATELERLKAERNLK